MENCQNCGETFIAKFCGNCGQKQYKRIDRKYIVDEFQYSFLHANKGFFYSILKIIKNPGKTAREFIDGNRVNHYKPLLLAFVISGISAFISFKVIHLNEMITTYLSDLKIHSDQVSSQMTFNTNYNSFLMLLCIPLFSVFTFISFKKWGNKGV